MHNFSGRFVEIELDWLTFIIAVTFNLRVGFIKHLSYKL